MTDWDPNAFNTAIIADMRANGGKVTSGPLAGSPLLILTTTGARSGEPRMSVLTYTRDGDAYVVAGSKGGSPTDPHWFNNLKINPDVKVEVEGRSFDAQASISTGKDHDVLWDRHVAALPNFAEYPEKAGRVIPMIRLTPIG
ncbi:MAG TPA: nitroreductase/quinone reductase family protein [Candidatus Limnocylindrales bacterium]|jgi:deazaflavin-dependent oxidoreductase (nitroreductase family)